MLQISGEKFEELNRMASEKGFVSVEAYLMFVATEEHKKHEPSEEVISKRKAAIHKSDMETQSKVDSGRQGA
jgi:hypothetical protein